MAEIVNIDHLHWTSAFELASMIRRRELKPSELMAATIARIEALNPSLNAFCALRANEAMAEAYALDEKIVRTLRCDAKSVEHRAYTGRIFGPFNFSGHPAASVRAGMTDSGLPCGLQIVAERYREDLVLQASHAYEQARPWNHRWPNV